MKPVAEQTLYEILEVPADAPESEIVKAWERAEALYGPGSLTTYALVSPEEAAVMGAKLEEALSVLLNPAERLRYDADIRAGPAANGVHRADAAAWDAPAPAPRPPASPPFVLPSLAEQAASEDEVASASPGEVEEGDAFPARAGDGLEPGREVEEAPPAAVAAHPDDAEPLEPPPILLTRVVEEPRPIPLATPAPISPPFAALLDSPAALAVSPLSSAAPATEPARPRQGAPGGSGFVIPEGTPYTGEVLRRAREARGLGMQELCERTKIARHHLENLEADRRDRLPAPVYLRGILMALARELRLDGQKVARSYLDAASGLADGRSGDAAPAV